MLHAAAIHPDLFATVITKTHQSWTNIVGDQNAQGQLDSIVNGALQVYDLPDPSDWLECDKVKFETTKD